jgi:hypothetical protein
VGTASVSVMMLMMMVMMMRLSSLVTFPFLNTTAVMLSCA